MNEQPSAPGTRDPDVRRDPTERGIGPGDDMHLTVPAVTAFVSVLRATVAGVGTRLDLDLDSVEDLRLAVNEAAAMLLEHGVADGRLACLVAVEDGGLRVRLSAAVHDATPPSQTSFTWAVLSALVPDIDVQATDNRLRIDLWFPLPAAR